MMLEEFYVVVVLGLMYMRKLCLLVNDARGFLRCGGVGADKCQGSRSGWENNFFDHDMIYCAHT